MVKGRGHEAAQPGPSGAERTLIAGAHRCGTILNGPNPQPIPFSLLWDDTDTPKHRMESTMSTVHKATRGGAAVAMAMLCCITAQAQNTESADIGEFKHRAHDPGPRPNPTSPVPTPVPGLNANEANLFLES